MLIMHYVLVFSIDSVWRPKLFWVYALVRSEIAEVRKNDIHQKEFELVPAR